MGAIDDKGAIRVPLIYDSLASHYLGFRALLKGEWYLLDKLTGERKIQKGYTLISSSFPRVGNTRLAAVKYGNKEGFINSDCVEIVPAIYDSVELLANRYAIGIRNRKTVLLDEITGKEKTPLKYDVIRAFNNHALVVGMLKTNTMGIISSDGAELVKPIYQIIYATNRPVMVYKRNNKYGLMNEDWTEITTPLYDSIDQWFKDNKLKATIKEKIVFLDEKGNVLQ